MHCSQKQRTSPTNMDIVNILCIYHGMNSINQLEKNVLNQNEFIKKKHFSFLRFVVVVGLS